MPKKTKTDWKRLSNQTDTDIDKAVASDPDTFIPDDAFWEKALKTPAAKQSITIRVDADILDFFKGKNPKGYQQRMNAALRAYMEALRQQQA